MKVEILTLCDYAQAYGDRLTIVGAFSTINAEKFPINMSDVTLVVKIVLDENDNKKHDISVLIKKESDSEPIVGPISTPLDMSESKGNFITANLILKIGHLTIPSQGKYDIVFSFDGTDTVSQISAIVPKQ